MTNERPYKRTDRVALQILQILGEITTKHIDLSHLGFVTFTRVDVSPDLRHSKVFYSVINSQLSEKLLNEELNKMSKAFRKYLGQEIQIKNTPDLVFYLDETVKHEEHMMKIFKNLKSDSE